MLTTSEAGSAQRPIQVLIPSRNKKPVTRAMVNPANFYETISIRERLMPIHRLGLLQQSHIESWRQKDCLIVLFC